MKLSKPCLKNKMRHYLLLNQEEIYLGTPTIMPHLQKVIQAGQDYREYIAGLKYGHNCDQFKKEIYVNLNLYLYSM